MTCASCVNRIERYLRKVDGIEVANVNLATERATVVAKPEVTVEQILAAVEAAGYDARLVIDEAPGLPAATTATPTTAQPRASAGEVVLPGNETSYQQRHLADIRRRLIVATILTIPLLARPGVDDHRAVPAGLAAQPVAATGAGHARPVLRRLAFLPGCLEGAPPPRHGHEHAYRAGHVGGVFLLAGGDPGARLLRSSGPGGERRAAAVLRQRGDDHHAHLARPVPGGASAQPHVGCDQEAGRIAATDGTHPARHSRP